MSAPTRLQILTLYTSLLRTSRSFASYNFRTYFLRRTRHAFQTSPPLTPQAFEEWKGELEVLKRAAVVNRLYEGPKLVVERVPRMGMGGGGAGMEASAGGGGQDVDPGEVKRRA